MKRTDTLKPGAYYHIYNCGINSENIFRDTNDHIFFLKLLKKYINPIADIYAWCLMKNHFHLLIRIKDNITYRYTLSPKQGDIKNGNSQYYPVLVDKDKFEELKWETVPLLPNQSACEAPDCIGKNNNIGKSNIIEKNDNLPPDFQKNNIISTATHCIENISLNPLDLKTPNATNHMAHLFSTYSKYINSKYSRHGALLERPFKRRQIDNQEYFRRVVVYIHNNPLHHNFCDDIIEYPWVSYHSYISGKTTNEKLYQILEWFNDIDNFIHLHENKYEIFNVENWFE